MNGNIECFLNIIHLLLVQKRLFINHFLIGRRDVHVRARTYALPANTFFQVYKLFNTYTLEWLAIGI